MDYRYRSIKFEIIFPQDDDPRPNRKVKVRPTMNDSIYDLKQYILQSCLYTTESETDVTIVYGGASLSDDLMIREMTLPSPWIYAKFQVYVRRKSPPPAPAPPPVRPEHVPSPDDRECPICFEDRKLIAPCNQCTYELCTSCMVRLVKGDQFICPQCARQHHAT